MCSGNVYLGRGFGSGWPKFPWPKFPRPVFSRPTRSRCPRSRCSRGRHSRVRSVIPSDRFESTWLEWPNFAADVSRARPIFRGRYFAHFQYSRPVFCGRYFAADIPLPRRIFRGRFPLGRYFRSRPFPSIWLRDGRFPVHDRPPLPLLSRGSLFTAVCPGNVLLGLIRLGRPELPRPGFSAAGLSPALSRPSSPR